MKIHKENVKLFLKDKNTKIAFVLLTLFFCVFIVSFTSFATSIKGVSELFHSSKINHLYSNNYSTIYAVDKNNTLYYSYNKRSASHLNAYEGISSLDNEYGDATAHEYNFISISYQFNSPIVKVDGFRDNIFGMEGYTLVLTKDHSLYALDSNIQKGSPLLKIATNVLDFDVGYANFTVVDTHNDVYEYIHKNAYYYRINTLKDQAVQMVATQGHKRENNLYKYISYYVTKQNGIIQNELTIAVDQIGNYQLDDTDIEVVKEIKNAELFNQRAMTFEQSIKQIKAIENATILLTKENQVYAIGDNYINDNLAEEDYGIFGVEDTHCVYNQFTPIATNVKNIKNISTGGPFCLILKTKDGFYYSGNIGFEQSIYFKKITSLGKIDEIVPGFYSTIVLKKGIVYYIDYEEDYSLMRMYENYFVKYIVKYVSLFLVVMTIFYIVYYFIEENGKYNRYFKRRYENEKN